MNRVPLVSPALATLLLAATLGGASRAFAQSAPAQSSGQVAEQPSHRALATLLVIDGTPQPAWTRDSLQAHGIADPHLYVRLEVLDERSSRAIYGDAGSGGALIITLSDEGRRHLKSTLAR